jgi:hypothetical protein
VLGAIDQAVQRPAHLHADVNHVNVRPTGNRRDQALRRLRKNRPDLPAQVLAGQELLLVQCTCLSNLSSRVKKAKAWPEVAAWLRAGGKFECWGWFRRGGKWDVKQVDVSIEDLAGEVVRLDDYRYELEALTCGLPARYEVCEGLRVGSRCGLGAHAVRHRATEEGLQAETCPQTRHQTNPQLAPVRHTSERIAIPLICCGHIDCAKQAWRRRMR